MLKHDGMGWPEKGPFEGIIVTAAPVSARELLDQLADGGVLIAPVGEENQVLVEIIEGATVPSAVSWNRCGLCPCLAGWFVNGA